MSVLTPLMSKLDVERARTAALESELRQARAQKQSEATASGIPRSLAGIAAAVKRHETVAGAETGRAAVQSKLAARPSQAQLQVGGLVMGAFAAAIGREAAEPELEPRVAPTPPPGSLQSLAAAALRTQLQAAEARVVEVQGSAARLEEERDELAAKL
eukprot:SAG11_NODE_1726_length_4370_cov_3.340904_1_plen_158_part_00